MKRLQTLALAGLLLGTAMPVAAESYREQSQRTFDVAGVSGLRADNPRGRIELHRSPDKQIHVTALKETRANDREAARRLASEITVEIGRQGGMIEVRVRYPRRASIDVDFWDLLRGRTVPRSELTLDLALPERFPVTIVTRSGEIESDQITGSQSLRSASGDVNVHEAAGTLDVKTTSGDVNVTGGTRARIETVSGDVLAESVRGSLSLTTTNGDLSLRDARDSLALQTVTGDIDVDRAPGGISATTTNGNVEVHRAAGPIRIVTTNGDVSVECVAPLGRVDIATSTGDIELELAERLGFRLEARTASGDIDIQVPLEVRTVSRQVVSGVVRGGTTPVSLRTSSGDITLVGGGQ